MITPIRCDLHENEGLYEMKLSPLYMDDLRGTSAHHVEITLDHDSKLWGTDDGTQTKLDMKSPTKLGHSQQNVMDECENGSDAWN